MLKVLKFGATWCGPCKTLDKVIESVKSDFDVFESVDVDDNSDLVNEYNIKSVPTMVFIVDGDEKERVVGAVLAQALRSTVRKYV